MVGVSTNGHERTLKVRSPIEGEETFEMKA